MLFASGPFHSQLPCMSLNANFPKHVNRQLRPQIKNENRPFLDPFG